MRMDLCMCVVVGLRMLLFFSHYIQIVITSVTCTPGFLAYMYHILFYPMAAHAQSGGKHNKQSVFCLSVVKKILKSILCAQHTALKNI